MLQLPGDQNTVCTTVFQGLAGILFSMAARSWYYEVFLLVFIARDVPWGENAVFG